MRTIVYIDGFNLYYGLLRGTPWMWLDLVAFARALLTDRYVISEVKYFTARIRSDRFAAISPHDQSCYLDALGTNPVVKVVEGIIGGSGQSCHSQKSHAQVAVKSDMRPFGKRKRRNRT